MIYSTSLEPQTPRYRGPVRDMIPEYGRGYVETFCPTCGGTDVVNTHDRDHFVCRTCGRRFVLAGQSEYNEDARYEIIHGGSPEYENVPRWDLLRKSWDAVMDHMDDTDTYYNLARDYYGQYYEQYETEEAMLDPACAVSRENLVGDIPYRELETVIDRGYIEGMDIGDTVDIPDTPLSIRRTRNIKRGRR